MGRMGDVHFVRRVERLAHGDLRGARGMADCAMVGDSGDRGAMDRPRAHARGAWLYVAATGQRGNRHAGADAARAVSGSLRVVVRLRDARVRGRADRVAQIASRTGLADRAAAAVCFAGKSRAGKGPGTCVAGAAEYRYRAGVDAGVAGEDRARADDSFARSRRTTDRVARGSRAVLS